MAMYQLIHPLHKRVQLHHHLDQQCNACTFPLTIVLLQRKKSNPSLSSYIPFAERPSHILGRPKIIHHVFHDLVEIKGR